MHVAQSFPSCFKNVRALGSSSVLNILTEKILQFLGQKILVVRGTLLFQQEVKASKSRRRARLVKCCITL